MTLDEFQQDLSKRMGKRVTEILTRDGESVQDLTDLYQPSPAGFAGQVVLVGGSRHSWELWQEAEAMWNFQSTHIT
ncbi:hypothetical protein [Synechococcus sp. WH 8016]|jgi:hypothetical protein|uniref:hypothetical protein n=1 Tax=Synechococcus sp. WH 8016 TaxID=166318 RepID=UPI00022D7D67|nr:hypothetical protein [Synechococcus sp. WH 8016]EHA63485.1 hypothetical protein Syn8016DRAFT_0526 [Synechococcus sp. WH 8016]NKB73344.1 hypothetical protein [Synechococcus sp. s2_metabat2_7]